jgi:hypothetical protein
MPPGYAAKLTGTLHGIDSTKGQYDRFGAIQADRCCATTTAIGAAVK